MTSIGYAEYLAYSIDGGRGEVSLFNFGWADNILGVALSGFKLLSNYQRRIGRHERSSECGKKARSGWQMRDLSLNVPGVHVGQENHDDEVSATIGSFWIPGCTSVTAYE